MDVEDSFVPFQSSQEANNTVEVTVGEAAEASRGGHRAVMELSTTSQRRLLQGTYD